MTVLLLSQPLGPAQSSALSGMVNEFAAVEVLLDQTELTPFLLPRKTRQVGGVAQW